MAFRNSVRGLCALCIATSALVLSAVAIADPRPLRLARAFACSASVRNTKVSLWRATTRY
jgi:hypothetical protein